MHLRRKFQKIIKWKNMLKKDQNAIKVEEITGQRTPEDKKNETIM